MRADRDQQQHGVEQGGEDRRAAQAVGVARRRRRARQHAAPQASSRPSTSRRLWPASASRAIESGDEAEDGLDHDEAEVERRCRSRRRGRNRRGVDVARVAMAW